MQGLKASTLRPRCPLWVKSRHLQCKKACPIYRRLRTLRGSERLLSANSGHRLFDRDVHAADILDHTGHHIARRHRPNALRRSGHDHVAWI
jgi:hypothetical protein